MITDENKGCLSMTTAAIASDNDDDTDTSANNTATTGLSNGEGMSQNGGKLTENDDDEDEDATVAIDCDRTMPIAATLKTTLKTHYNDTIEYQACFIRSTTSFDTMETIDSDTARKCTINQSREVVATTWAAVPENHTWS